MTLLCFAAFCLKINWCVNELMQIPGMFWRITRFGRHICLWIKVDRSSLTISLYCICICEPLPHLPVPTAMLWVVVWLPSHGPGTVHCHWEVPQAPEPAARAVWRHCYFLKIIKIIFNKIITPTTQCAPSPCPTLTPRLMETLEVRFQYWGSMWMKHGRDVVSWRNCLRANCYGSM